jgi:hypothetical protein
MKKLKQILKTSLLVVPISLLAACSSENAKYQNLATGEKVYIIKDAKTGASIDSLTNEPVMFYVDLNTKDTISGSTGLVVNNKIVKSEDGTYALITTDEGMSYEGDVKIKVDGDEIKIKTDDKKIKIDGDEKKVKYDN